MEDLIKDQEASIDSLLFSVEDDIEAVDLSDLFSDGGINLDEVENADENITATEVNFNNLYYVDYLGLNALTLLKEDIEIIKTVIKFNINKKKLKVFTQDMEHFAKHIRFLAINKDSKTLKTIEERSRAIILVDEFTEKVEELKKLLNEYTMQLDFRKEDAIGRGYENDYDPKNINVSKIIENIITKNRGTARLESVLESIINFYKKKEELKTDLKKDKFKDMVAIYKDNAYSYTDLDINVLTKLNFPTALIGNEDLIKPENIKDTYDESLQNPTGKEFKTNVENKTLCRVYNAYMVYQMNLNTLNY